MTSFTILASRSALTIRCAASAAPTSAPFREAPQRCSDNRCCRAACPARACLALAFGLIFFTPPAWAQDRSPYERLDRLERDLNMLQRQVYRGAPAYAPDGAAAVNVQLRMDRLEAEHARSDRPGRGIREPARAAAAAGRTGQRRHERRFDSANRAPAPASQGPAAAAMPPRPRIPSGRRAPLVRQQCRSGRVPMRTRGGRTGWTDPDLRHADAPWNAGWDPGATPRRGAAGAAALERAGCRPAAAPASAHRDGVRCRTGRRPSSTIMRSAL